jgi:hypothetical protein
VNRTLAGDIGHKPERQHDDNDCEQEGCHCPSRGIASRLVERGGFQ